LKTFIQNRKGQKIAVVVDEVPEARGLVFVMHGLSGNKEELHINMFAHAFKEKGYTAVRFDTTNTFGESEGDYEDATTTNYYEDLEDVINWAATQSWYQEPFCLVGHSLGGLCVALYAEKHPGKVKALAPISTVVSGTLSAEARGAEEMEQWEKSGWEKTESSTKPGLIKRLKWSHMLDRLQYDLLPQVKELTMPVFLLAGELDDSTPPLHQKILFDALPGSKEIHTIAGAPHTFRDPKHLAEIKSLLTAWIKKL